MKLNLFNKKEPSKEKEMIEIQMENGSVERFPESFVIDKEYCVKCGSSYHWHLDCPNFRESRKLKINLPLKAMKRYDADAQGLEKCWKCDEYDRLEGS